MLGDYSYLQAKKAQSKRKSTFGSLFFLFMGGGLELVLFTFFFNIYVSKSDLFVPLTVRGSPIAYASLLVSLYVLIGKRRFEIPSHRRDL